MSCFYSCVTVVTNFFISLYMICKEECSRILCSKFGLYSFPFLSLLEDLTTTSLNCSHLTQLHIFLFLKISYGVYLVLPIYIWVGTVHKSLFSLLGAAQLTKTDSPSPRGHQLYPRSSVRVGNLCASLCCLLEC